MPCKRPCLVRSLAAVIFFNVWISHQVVIQTWKLDNQPFIEKYMNNSCILTHQITNHYYKCFFFFFVCAGHDRQTQDVPWLEVSRWIDGLQRTSQEQGAAGGVENQLPMSVWRAKRMAEKSTTFVELCLKFDVETASGWSFFHPTSVFHLVNFVAGRGPRELVKAQLGSVLLVGAQPLWGANRQVPPFVGDVTSVSRGAWNWFKIFLRFFLWAIVAKKRKGSTIDSEHLQFIVTFDEQMFAWNQLIFPLLGTSKLKTATIFSGIFVPKTFRSAPGLWSVGASDLGHGLWGLESNQIPLRSEPWDSTAASYWLGQDMCPLPSTSLNSCQPWTDITISETASTSIIDHQSSTRIGWPYLISSTSPYLFPNMFPINFQSSKGCQVSTWINRFFQRFFFSTNFLQLNNLRKLRVRCMAWQVLLVVQSPHLDALGLGRESRTLAHQFFSPEFFWFLTKIFGQLLKFLTKICSHLVCWFGEIFSFWRSCWDLIEAGTVFRDLLWAWNTRLLGLSCDLVSSFFKGF